ncbi:MAG: lactonase family protein [Gemmatimonadaceae bacterium]|nr:lactonase family protein [Gemmatimonadaceae bacterium]
MKPTHSQRRDARLSRRDFVGASALAALGVASWPARDAEAMTPGADSWELYVGTYTNGTASRGIYRLEVNKATGAFANVSLVAECPDPSYLALSPDRRRLVAVNELVSYEGKGAGALTTYARDVRSGALTRLNERSSLGGAPCYVAFDHAGQHVLLANYVGGNVAVFPVGDQGAGESTAFVQHAGAGPNRTRQAGPHAHCIVVDPRGAFALAADLGTDAIEVYRYDAAGGRLLPSQGLRAALAPGAGPRHLAFAPDGRSLYVVNELDSTLVAFPYRATTAIGAQRQVIGTRHAGATGNNFPADLHVHPSGRAVYVSNRGDNTIAVFSVAAATGKLALVQTIATGGDWPRNFALDPSGRFLLVAHQRSHVITSFAVDAATGRLARTGAEANVSSPVCLRFSA